METAKNYIPALGFNWLTGMYDKIISLTMPEKEFRQALITEAFGTSEISSALEFGVGTASNAILAQKQYSNVQIIGLDVDDKVLSIARKKIEAEDQSIELTKYDGLKIPFSDSSFDLVYSCLVFHHLMPDQKKFAFDQIKRVLKPNGRFVFIDWGKPNSLYAQAAFHGLRLFDGWKNTADNANGNYLKMIARAGFNETKRLKHFNTIYGTLELISTTKKK
jgi:ubiquinone/menaquinone biosynthesis C-methylase UbiE